MRSSARTARVGLALVLALLPTSATARAQDAPKARTAAVAGRVTVDGKPAAGVGVALAKDLYAEAPTPVAKATTDRDGAFRIDGLAAGRYYVVTSLAGYVSRSESDDEGSAVIVGDGEQVKDVAIALTRGGVVTGRVTDAEDAPLVGQQIALTRIGDDGSHREVSPVADDYTMMRTDDRGIYRVYGLAAGKYLVAAGDANDASSTRFGTAAKRYARRFYPGVASETDARLVEVTAGGEATGVDIALSDRYGTFSVSGRVVDAESGTPLRGVLYGYGPARDGRFVGAAGYGGYTDDAGAFRIDGIAPGTYAAYAAGREATRDYYADPEPFEITTANVSGVTVKMHLGGSISGTVAIEGAAPAEAEAVYSSIELFARGAPGAEDAGAVTTGWGRVRPDGSFEIDRLRPGAYLISADATTNSSQAAFVRIERDGTPTSDPIAVAAGGDVTNVRVVLAIGSGAIRGRVTIAGTRPADCYLTAEIRSAVSNTIARTVGVGSDGQFLAESLAPGDYVVTVAAHVQRQASGPPETIRGSEVHVTVARDSQAQANLAIDFGGTDDGGRP
jgi:carboxypeptidase family protein